MESKIFDDNALKIAKMNINKPEYKWMKTEQINDFNFDNYLDIDFEIIMKSITNITVKEKSIHPYKLSFLIITIDDKSYTLEPKKNNKSSIYKFTINKNLDGLEIILSAEVTPINKNDGLLDIEIDKKMILK